MGDHLVDYYWKKSSNEIKTLDKICAWDVIDSTDDMNVVGSKWSYRLKRFQ